MGWYFGYYGVPCYQVALVGALVSRLQRLLGSVRSKSPYGGLHAAEDAGGC